MSEQEYIDASNKAKLNAAWDILRGIDETDLDACGSHDLRRARQLISAMTSNIKLDIDCEKDPF